MQTGHVGRAVKFAMFQIQSRDRQLDPGLNPAWGSLLSN